MTLDDAIKIGFRNKLDESLDEYNIEMTKEVKGIVISCVINYDLSKYSNTKIRFELNVIVIKNLVSNTFSKISLCDFLNSVNTCKISIGTKELKRFYIMNRDTVKIVHTSKIKDFPYNMEKFSNRELNELQKVNISLVLFKGDTYYDIIGIIYKNIFIREYVDMKYTECINDLYGYKSSAMVKSISVYDMSFNPRYCPNLEIFEFIYKYKDRYIISTEEKDGYEEKWVRDRFRFSISYM